MRTLKLKTRIPDKVYYVTLCSFGGLLMTSLTGFICLSCSTTNFPASDETSQATSLSHPSQSPKDAKSSQRKVLFLGLDGIGFHQFKKMQGGGYFKNFRPVAPMIATFPSISDPNWTKILRATPEMSFTKEHFDRQAGNGLGQIVGGLLDHVFSPPHYETLFDFKPEGPVQQLASMTYSETVGLYWLDALEESLLNSGANGVFKAFIVNTDFIAHTKGEDAILRYLGELDKKLFQLQKRFQNKWSKELEIVLVSDHGNAYLKPVAIEVDQKLMEKGWQMDEALQQNDSVVYVIPEILSFAAFYVKSGRESELASSLSFLDGAFVSFFIKNKDARKSKILNSNPNKIQIQFIANSGADQTLAEYDLKKRTVSYKILSGKDPFVHWDFFKNGPLGFHKYFLDTLMSEYPNALVRALEALTENTQQSASVLVSSKLGYVFSNKKLEFITKVMGLESVHGSFHRDETLGIFVSTHQDLPAVHPFAVLQFVK